LSPSLQDISTAVSDQPQKKPKGDKRSPSLTPLKAEPPDLPDIHPDQSASIQQSDQVKLEEGDRDKKEIIASMSSDEEEFVFGDSDDGFGQDDEVDCEP
jgi:hypothetical protein